MGGLEGPRQRRWDPDLRHVTGVFRQVQVSASASVFCFCFCFCFRSAMPYSIFEFIIQRLFSLYNIIFIIHYIMYHVSCVVCMLSVGRNVSQGTTESFVNGIVMLC